MHTEWCFVHYEYSRNGRDRPSKRPVVMVCVDARCRQYRATHRRCRREFFTYARLERKLMTKSHIDARWTVGCLPSQKARTEHHWTLDLLCSYYCSYSIIGGVTRWQHDGRIVVRTKTSLVNRRATKQPTNGGGGRQFALENASHRQWKCLAVGRLVFRRRRGR